MPVPPLVATKIADPAKKRKHVETDVKKEEESVELKKQKLETRVYTLEVKFPEYWCTPFNQTLRIELYPEDEEYKKVVAMMLNTISETHCAMYHYKSFNILRIYRLQNPTLWGYYYLRKGEVVRNNDGKPDPINGMKLDLLDPEANECIFLVFFFSFSPVV